MLKVFTFLLLACVSGFGATGLGVSSKVVYVNSGGNLFAAKNNAQAGTTIVVGPGTYNNATNLLKGGVNWYFMPGAKVTAGPDSLPYTYIFGDIDTGAVTSNIAGYGEFWVTNNSGLGSVYFCIDANSKVSFEYQSAVSFTNCQTITAGPGEHVINCRDFTRSHGYDCFVLGDSGIPPAKFFLNCARAFADNTIVEAQQKMSNPGDCVANIDYAEITPGTSPGGDLNALMLADNMVITIGTFRFRKTEVITGVNDSAGATTGSGTLKDCRIIGFSGATASVIQRMASGFNTSLTLRNCTIVGPTGVDPIEASPSIGKLTIQDCTIQVGASATNWVSVSSLGACNVRLFGGLNVNRTNHASVTVIGKSYTTNDTATISL